MEQPNNLTYPHPYKDFAHLKTPLEVKKYIHHADNYIVEGKNKNTQRKIFYGVEYTEYEKENILELKEAVAKANLDMPSDFTDADYLKFVFSGSQKIEQSLKVALTCFYNFDQQRIKQHLQWRQNISMHNLYGPTDMAQIILEQGLIYQFGRDNQFRPILVVNIYEVKSQLAKKIISTEDFIRAMSYIMTGVRLHMFLDQYIENWIMIMDINFMSVFGIPFKTLGKIFDITFYAMNSTLEKVFLLNPSFSLLSIWKIVVSMMGRGTPEKIQMLKKKNFSKMFQYISPDQVEEKFGGSHKNLQIYWPPTNTIQTMLPANNQPLESIQKQMIGVQEEQKTSLQEQDNNSNLGSNQDDLTPVTKFYSVEEEEINDTENCQIGQVPNCDFWQKSIQQTKSKQDNLTFNFQETVQIIVKDREEDLVKQNAANLEQDPGEENEFYSCRTNQKLESDIELKPIQINELQQTARNPAFDCNCCHSSSLCFIF